MQPLLFTTTMYVTKPTRSTQPCIPPGSLNRVPALIGWGKGGNVTSAGWQVILCDPIWHVSSRSGEACGELLYPVTYFTYLPLLTLSTFTESVNSNMLMTPSCLFLYPYPTIYMTSVTTPVAVTLCVIRLL